MKKYLWKILKWITTIIPSREGHLVSLHHWETQVSKWLDTQGNLNTMKRIKAIRLHVTRYMCGHPLRKSAHPGIGLNSIGLPKSLGPLLDLIHGDEWDKRYLLTLLSVSRVIPCSGTVSTEDITNPGISVPEEVIQEHLKTLEILGWSLERPQWSEFHFSLKSGPNGQAMMGSIHDAHHLTSKDLENIQILGNSQDLLDKISLIKLNFSSQNWSEKYFWQDKNLTRKLSLVSDPEAKERVIAIFDYWSQTVLKPLHDALIEYLRGVPGDCTYNQQGPSRFLPNSGPYYSMDLHAATDRYPAILQRAVLSRLVNSNEYADAWYSIMTDKPFANPWGADVKYGRGQPMGAYSSWAMFALCHHLTVRTAARLCGINPHSFTQYALLGDDIVLTNPEVAEKYTLLMDQLGVELSIAKTHVSENTYEFAKRWYQAGIEISGAQLSAFANISKWSEAAEELRSLYSRWSMNPLEMESGSIRHYLLCLGLRVRDYRKVVSFLYLPTKGDSEESRWQKYNYLCSRFFPEVFGCFDRQAIREPFVLQTLAEVKTSLMEEGIQRVFSLSQAFMQEVVRDFSGELVDQSALLALPPVMAIRSQAIKLQESFDQLREAYYDNDEDIISGNIIMALCDPSRIITKRTSKMILESRSSIVNKYKFWARDYQVRRDHLLSDFSTPPDENDID